MTYPLAELRDYIDWQPFFNAWEMKGKFPDILDNPTTGETARELYDDGQEMLDRIIAEDWLTPTPSTASSPPTRWATTWSCTPTTPHRGGSRLHHLRQQGEHRAGVPNRACRTTSPRGRRDWPTTWAASRSPPVWVPRAHRALQGRARRLQRDPAGVAGRPAGRGLRRAAARAGPQASSGATPPTSTLERGPDRRALRRHPAGARATPRAPTTPRRRRSGAARRRGARPASGSPSPWRCGPAPRSAGWYFSHPQSQYFVVGRLGRDQVADYADRKGWTLAETERWLSPNLGYDPED